MVMILKVTLEGLVGLQKQKVENGNRHLIFSDSETSLRERHLAPTTPIDPPLCNSKKNTSTLQTQFLVQFLVQMLKIRTFNFKSSKSLNTKIMNNEEKNDGKYRIMEMLFEQQLWAYKKRAQGRVISIKLKTLGKHFFDQIHIIS